MKIVESTNRRAVRALLSPERLRDAATDRRVAAIVGDVRREGDRVIIEAAARSFLHHQVRSMVGTLALVGQGQWREEQVAEALAAKDRAALGLNAPSEGLYFVRAVYPED